MSETTRWTVRKLDSHPEVAPYLDAFRRARAARDAVLLDGRYGEAARKKAERAVAEALDAYDAAIKRVLWPADAS